VRVGKPLTARYRFALLPQSHHWAQLPGPMPHTNLWLIATSPAGSVGGAVLVDASTW